MSGQLYLVGTPIGNLGDISSRAVETLKSVDVIACEDTRHTMGLLNYFSIKKPLFSYYKQKEQEGSDYLLGLIADGKNVALVSDAGMPCISDPGAVVVKKAREMGYKTSVVPGPTAFASALALVGIDGPFTFIGFLPEKNKEKKEMIARLFSSPFPLVFYVAPHDIEKILTAFYTVFGTRKYYAVREITKIYESVFEGQLGTDVPTEQKGEFVLIVMPEENKKEILSDEAIIDFLRKETASGKDKKEAVKAVVKTHNLSKNKVYKLSLFL